ncbi:response regulator transcription factor [Microbacterium sp. SORGH_AS_0888]|uniref:response regulator n=1 Tax=Microbacterium sp. SORGH_AS_0888 TaxID=3041791 RepID=UPI00278480C8|nr:response regulator transcription factor [Microbacterium sp. SORGH_AS_0888]MDQ1129509.1 DNA-binding NarL/FixJ family response regulator [Microbacterium sp. SORGH_AS_0888]
MIRVLIADDHPVVRVGLAAVLEAVADVTVVGAVATGLDAVTAAAAADVVLMDLRMPELDGTAATARIRARHPHVRVLVLTTYETDDAILGAIGAGASGYLLKAAPEGELLAGVRAVARGEMALAPTVARALARQATAAPAPRLSGREHQVLELVAAGLSNRGIGERLHLGEATVKTHLLHVFAKLGVGDRTRAVTRAMELGIL